MPLAQPVLKIAGRLVRASYPRTLAYVHGRVELPLVLNARGLTGQGAEIGVRDGGFSELLLDSWKGQRLTSVDPWLADDPDAWRNVDNVPQSQQDALYVQTCERLARFGDRSVVSRKSSAQAVSDFHDKSLDFVYIDARHDEPSVTEDLALWSPKVRAGGLLMGHDYVDGFFDEGEFGVRTAVDRFCRQHSLSVFATRREPHPSWMIVIPEAIEVLGV